MTDYQEEQANEIEALESIYPDEIQIVSTTPYHCFRMVTTSQCDDCIENATCILQFTYTEKYPDEVPVIEVLGSEIISDEDVQMLLNIMKEQAEENLGMGMIFTLISAAQEKLTAMVEDAAKAEEDEKERKLQELEEAERKRLEGTHVTIETFLEWKKSFDAEMAEIRKAKGKTKQISTKLTGKELFMSDHTLDDSDVKFLDDEEGGTAVTVDESLFQELDDLDLGADLDLDEDLDGEDLDVETGR